MCVHIVVILLWLAGFRAFLSLSWSSSGSHLSRRRLWGEVDQPLQVLHRGSEEELGLSKPKKIYARVLAESLLSGALDLRLLETLDLEAAEAHLCAVKGIGPWTARTYLLFCHGAADAWPAGDVALHVAAQRLLDLDQRPSTPEMLEIAEAWRPARGVAAHILWAYYKTN